MTRLHLVERSVVESGPGTIYYGGAHLRHSVIMSLSEGDITLHFTWNMKKFNVFKVEV